MRSVSAAIALTAVFLMVSGANVAHADGIGPALSAARESKPIFEMRWRSETVDQTGMGEDADAVTLRGRVGFETGKAWNTSFLAEADLLWPLSTHYNSTTNGKTGYPIVADPESYEINRLQFANTSIQDTTVILGRQRIGLDDQRFVGNVGWRQNEQTFDSLHVINKTIPNVTFDMAYVDQVNRIYGKESPVGRYHGDTYLANVSYQLPFGKLTGFSYLLDFDRAPTDSTRTLGMRFSGDRRASHFKLAYVVSYASQEEYANNPRAFSDDFFAAELIATYKQYNLGAGVELLEGDGVKGFTTPLATMHKFDGWADKFLTTPPNGLDHRYLTAGYTKKGFGVLDTLALNLVYHQFESERLAIDYGSEVDLQLQAKWQRFNLLLKYATYDAERFATDTNKLWAQVDFVW
jgi:hypothetical protein